MNANALSASAVGAEPVGTLGRDGYRILDSWAPVASAKQWAEAVTGMFETTRTEVARNLHLSLPWAEELVRSPNLLDAVEALIGPDIAIENTFLVVKWPDSNFEVPWHQDGINDRLRLDPLQSVAVWLALTDTRADSGCVEVVPDSHLRGYLDYGPEKDQGAARGRALGARVDGELSGVPIEVDAGGGLLMDPRLLHSSKSNRESTVRIGLNIRFVAPGGVVARDPSSPDLFPVRGTRR